MALFRTDQASITVAVSGITLDVVSWDKLDGGDNVSPGQNYQPGGMFPSVELGGMPKRSNITVERAWSDVLIGAYKLMDAGAGRLVATVTYTVLDASGIMLPSATLTYTGVLLEVHRPGYDATSSSAAMLQLVIGLNGAVN